MAGFFSAMAESWKNLKDTTAFSSFFLCVRIEIDQLRARDLISFTSDLENLKDTTAFSSCFVG